MAFREFNQESLRKYFANTSWLAAEKVVRIILYLVVGILVARYLGPESFGILSYALSFVALFTAVASLGMNAIIVRDIVNAPEKENAIMGTAFWLRVGGAVLVMLLLWGAVKLTAGDHDTNILIFIIGSGLIFQAFNVIDFYFQAKVLSKYTTIAQISQAVIISVIKLWLIYIKAGVFWFAVVALLESIVLAAGFIITYVHQRLSLCRWSFDLSIARRLLNDSYPLIFSGVFVSIYMRIDQVMIKMMLDSTAVGYYAVAVKVCEAWYFIPVIIAASVFPAILNARKADTAIYHDRLQKLYDLMVLLAVLIAIPTMLLSHWIINLLFGPVYSPAAVILQIYIWAGIFLFLGVANEKWYFAENLQLYALYRTLAGGVSNILLNLWLIPKMGIGGAAIATLISYSIASYWSMFFTKKSRQNFIMTTKSFNLISAIRRVFSI